MKQEDIVAMISTARDGWDYYKTLIQVCEDAYLMRMDDKKLEWLEKRNMSRLYFPKINGKCKRITDALSETYFNNDKFSKLSGYINSDEKVIECWQNGIDYYTEILNLYKTFQPIFQEISYKGTAVAKIYWDKEQARIDKVGIQDFWFDPNANTPEDVRYVVNNIYLTKSDIARLVKDKFYNATDVDGTFNESTPFERFMLQEIYYQDDEGGWRVTTVYNESVFLREDEKLKDGLPFVWGCLLVQVEEIVKTTYVCSYGEPVINAIIPLQSEYNETKNKMIDANKQHLSPKVIVPKTSGVSRVDLETVGKPIYTNQPSGVTVVPPPELSGSLQSTQMTEREMSENIGVSAEQNGIASAKNQTATESSIVNSEGSVRLQGYIRTFNETFFEKVFERLAMLVWKYGDPRLFLGIDRQELPSYKITLNTGIGALNKEVQKNGLTQSYQVVQNQAQLYMGVQDIESAKRMINAGEKIIREILPLQGIKDVNNFLGEEKDDKHSDNDFIQEAGGVSPQPEVGGVVPTPNIQPSVS